MAFNDTGVFTLHLAEMDAAVGAFARHLEGETLDPDVRVKYTEAINAIGQALSSLLCDSCEAEPCSVIRGASVYCAACEARWITCAACGCHLLETEAVYPTEDGDTPYHAACAPPEERAELDDLPGGVK